MGKDEQKGEAQAPGAEGFAGQIPGQSYGQQQFMGQQPYFTGARPQYQFQPQGQFMGQPPLGAFAGAPQGMGGQMGQMGQTDQMGQMGQAAQGYGQPMFQPQFQYMGQPQFGGQQFQPQQPGFHPQGQFMSGFMGQQPQGGFTAQDGGERLHDKNQYGQQNGPDMGQMYGMMQEVMKGDADPGKIMSFLQASGGDFWKGAIVGAAAVLLLTNGAVKDALGGVVGSIFGSKQAGEAEAAVPEEA